MSEHEKPGIDRAELLSRVEDDEELAREIVSIFQAEVFAYRQALQAAVESKSAEEIRKNAHAFKGMLANLAAGRASALAADLEQLGKANQLEPVHVAWKAFNDELSLVIRDVELFLSGAAK